MDPLSRFAQWFLPPVTYPFLFGLGLGASVWAQRAGFPPAVSVTSVLIGVGLIVWALEIWLPHTPRWRPSRRTFGLDLAHSLITSGGTSRLVEATLLAGLVVVGPRLFPGTEGSPWPAHWPLAAQLATALLLGEFGAYWVHRFCHRTTLGWRIHAVHHSVEQLHWLAAGRTHPFNALLVFSCQMGPLVLLGIPEETLGLVAVFTGINGYLQHANVKLSPGPASWFVSTSDHHRWHHAREGEASHTNFGNNLIVWDRLFGTHYDPSDRSPGLDIGIAETRIPEDFWAHLATPWQLGDDAWTRRPRGQGAGRWQDP